MIDHPETAHASPLTDEELIRRVGQGDHRAFELLVNRYQASALNVAYGFVGDAHEAQDLAQEAFLRVFRNAGRYQSMATFKTWFYRILGNLCLNALKKHRPLYWSEPPELTSTAEDPSRCLERRELQQAIGRALLNLPSNQRLAFILCHYEGLSYAEAARSLSLSVKAVDSLLGRAKQNLRRELAGFTQKVPG